MGRRFGFLLRYWWVLALATLGVATLLTAPREARPDEVENRMLAGAPVCSVDTILDGSFMTGVEEWLSDSVAGRRSLIETAERVQEAFALGGEDDTLAAAEILEAIGQETLATPEPTQGATAEEAVPAATQMPATAPATDAAFEELEETTFWVRNNDGAVRTVYRFPPENVANAAEILNLFRSALPEDGHVIFSETPVADTANSYLNLRDEYEAWGSDMEAALQAVVGDGVLIVNATEALLPHLENGEYLYFRSDHHWTARGAWIIYCAMMERLGVPPLAYEDYTYRVRREAFGSQGQGNHDVLEVMEAIKPVESYLLSDLVDREEVPFMAYGSSTYTAFLGGTRGPWRLFETGAHTGRTALLLGDSFSNALLPYLLPHYDRVIMTDPRASYYDARASGASMREYIEYYGVDDVYIMVCFATSINSTLFTRGTLVEHFDD